MIKSSKNSTFKGFVDKEFIDIQSNCNSMNIKIFKLNIRSYC